MATNKKDFISNVVAIVLAAIAVIQPVALMVQGQLSELGNVDWMQVVVLLVTSIIAMLTGRDKDGKAKVS